MKPAIDVQLRGRAMLTFNSNYWICAKETSPLLGTRMYNTVMTSWKITWTEVKTDYRQQVVFDRNMTLFLLQNTLDFDKVQASSRVWASEFSKYSKFMTRASRSHSLKFFQFKFNRKTTYLKLKHIFNNPYKSALHLYKVQTTVNAS